MLVAEVEEPAQAVLHHGGPLDQVHVGLLVAAQVLVDHEGLRAAPLHRVGAQLAETVHLAELVGVLRAGAVAVLGPADDGSVPAPGVPYVAAVDPRAVLGPMAARLYGHPVVPVAGPHGQAWLPG